MDQGDQLALAPRIRLQIGVMQMRLHGVDADAAARGDFLDGGPLRQRLADLRLGLRQVKQLAQGRD